MKPTDESKKEVCPVSHKYQYQRGSPKKSWKADLCTASGTRRVKNKCLSKYLVTLIIPLASDRQSKVSSHREASEPPQAVQNHLPQKKSYKIEEKNGWCKFPEPTITVPSIVWSELRKSNKKVSKLKTVCTEATKKVLKRCWPGKV